MTVIRPLQVTFISDALMIVSAVSWIPTLTVIKLHFQVSVNVLMGTGSVQRKEDVLNQVSNLSSPDT